MREARGERSDETAEKREEREERREERALVGAVSCELVWFVYFTNVVRAI